MGLSGWVSLVWGRASSEASRVSVFSKPELIIASLAVLVALLAWLLGGRGLLPWLSSRRLKRQSRARVRPQPSRALPLRRPYHGRERLLERLLERLASHSRLIVEGPRGCGKTALSLELAHSYLSAGRTSDWSAIWLDLKNRQAEFSTLVSELAHSIGVHSVLLVEEEARPSTLVREIANMGPILLVVDNIESITLKRDEALLFLDRLPENVAVLATSSEALPYKHSMALEHIGEMVFSETRDMIEGVSADDPRVQMALQEQEIVERIHETCGGNALAVKWCLGQIGMGRAAVDVLDEFRQGTPGVLSDLFDGVWKQLDDPSAQLACVVAHLPADPSVELLESIWRHAEHSASFSSAMEVNRETHLLESVRHPDREKSLVTMHPLVRQFIQGRVPTGYWGGISAPLSRALVEFMKNYGENAPSEDMRYVDSQVSLVFAALDSLIGDSRWSEAVALAVVAEESLLTLGYLWERGAYCLSLADHAPNTSSQPWAARLRVVGAQSLGLVGDYEVSNAELERAEQQARGVSLEQVVRARRARAANLLRQGEMELCALLLDDLEQSAVESGNQYLVVDVLYLLANYSYQTGQFADSEEYCRGMDAVVAEHGVYRRAIAYSQEQAALLHLERRQLLRARTAVAAAAAVANEFADVRQATRVRMVESKLAYFAARFRRAKRGLREAEVDFRRLALANEATEAVVAGRTVGLRDWARRLLLPSENRTNFSNLAIGAD